MNSFSFSPFGGVWRLTYRRLWAPKHWLPIVLWSALLGLLCHATVRDGRAQGYFHWAADTYLSLLVPIFAFIFGAGAIRDDLGPGMADYVFTRPVRRPAYLACKYLSHLACAQLDFLIPFAALLAVGASRHIPGLREAAPLLLLGQAVTIGAFSAFGFLCGVLTSRYVVIGLVYAAAVEAGLGNIPTELNRISLTHHVRAMLEPLAGHAGAAAEGPLATTLQLLLWSAGMLAAAAVVFSRRELAGPPREA
jgi:ABC-2 type transport system permease protein